MPRPILPIAAAVVGLAVVASVAVGVPHLQRRMRETEAVYELARLVRSASVYYVKPRAGADGTRMACQFPPGTIRTHLANSCCDPRVGDDGLCNPLKIEWNRTLWHTLHWQIREPHAFIYAYEASGTFGDARLTVSAYGDTDCDGEFSTFRFIAQGDPKARADDCVLDGAPRFEAIE